MGGNETATTYLALFEVAHANMKSQKYEPAMSQFKKLINEPFPSEWPASTSKYYIENAEWNLILAMLGSGQGEDDVMLRLNEILADQNQDYFEKAKAMKTDLNSFWRF